MGVRLDSVPTENLLELIFMAESSVDVQFQAWMAITFAVIVAVYSARAELGTSMRIVIASLYILAVVTLLTRFATEGARITLMLTELNSRGLEVAANFTAPLRFLVFVSGTSAAIFWIFRLRSAGASKSEH